VHCWLSLALQVEKALYLHNQDQPIIHRDLKSHNIFVHETFTDDTSIASDLKTKDGSIKMNSQSTVIARLELRSARATLSGTKVMTRGVRTACWLAQVIKHARRQSSFSDVYGYGIVLWARSREEVYQGLETTQIILKVANENLRPPIPQDCPWKDLMVQMLGRKSIGAARNPARSWQS
jgi:serine/threonine protein kinase